jgi:hypothetical protein
LNTRTQKLSAIFALLGLIYVLEVLLIPADTGTLTKFQISGFEAKLLSLTIALPVVAIWMTGCYVYSKFKNYVDTISVDKDGKAFNLISHGLLLLVAWLPISVIVSNFFTYLYHQNSSWTAPLTIANNYINLGLILLAFGFFYIGAYELGTMHESRKLITWKIMMFLPFAIISELFIFLSLTNPARQHPANGTVIAATYLPDWLQVGTLILPYILTFYFGFFGVLYIYIYRKKVKGVIYRSALDYSAKGWLCIVVSIIFIRYLASMTTLFTSSTLQLILFVLYLLVLILLFGFILMVKSVKKLEAIEKV